MTKPTEAIAQRLWRGALRHTGAGSADTPTVVPVELRLRWGDAPVAGNDPLAVGVGEACTRAVDRLLADLGIPGRTEASVILAGRGAPGLYALRVNGRRASLATGEMDAIVADLTRDGTSIDELPAEAVADVATAVCVAALHQRLSVLLREDHVARILQTDEAYPYGMELSDLTSVLAAVVDNGVSLRKSREIGRILGSRGGNESTVQLAELVIEDLRPTSVDLLCADQTMRRITAGDPDDLDLFIGLRTRIFDDFGIEFPDFHFVRDDIPDGCFAFRLNAVVTRLRHLGESAGLSEVATALEQDLRRCIAWFVSLTGLEELVGQLKALPDTVQAVRVRYPLPWLSAVGRTALDERMSLRQVATLLDWTIDLDPEPSQTEDIRLVEGPAPIGLADGNRFPSPRDAVALIRQRWMEELAWTSPREAPMYVRRLPAELEQAAEAGSLMPDNPVLSTLAAAVETMLAEDDAEDDKAPIVVSTLRARSRLRDALAPEFPDVQVYAEQEYPPSVRLELWPPPTSVTATPND
jgi:hypothetical protein